MKNILIIEDDPNIVSALKVRLRASGYATTEAGDAACGFSKALEVRPDLIVLDIGLPAGDGLELARKLRGRAETHSIPVVFVTANRDPNLRSKVMDMGAAGLFEKPYEADELLAVLGHALGETGTFRRPIARFSPECVPFTPDAPKTSAKQILVVEDDKNIAMALAVRLKAAGYETDIAYDALSGVNAAAKRHPDLVLLDISMPAGNGFSVAERLRNILPQPTPIIFLTASKMPGLRERAQEFGAAGFFEKPYEAEQLLSIVQQKLGGA